jgi:hypothetical protein
MRTRIADDPDSWGKPPDLQKPIASDDGKCPSCGVRWVHHMADMCPIKPGEHSAVSYARIVGLIFADESAHMFSFGQVCDPFTWGDPLTVMAADMLDGTAGGSGI